jgi:DHA2 family methylenomycin A resistance protein-like MFS transporter
MATTNRNSLILATLCLGPFMAILDTSLVNLGLHSIQADLHANMTALQWVVDLYNLVYAVLILTGGTLSDQYGRPRIFILGVAIFAAGSLLCALAPNAALLIAGRGIAGAGAALELPAALAILNLTYPNPRERAGAIALWGGMNGLAMAIGPTAGGILVSNLGWRSLFYAVLPVAAVTLVMAAVCLRETADPTVRRRLDLPGQILAIVTLGGLSLGFIEGPSWGWHTWPVIGCFAISALAGIAFIAVERRSREPLLPLSMFGSGAFSAAIADAALMTFGMYGLLFLLPLYLQAIRGSGALLAGIELLPMSATFFVVSPLAGRVATRIGPRILIAGGMALTGFGLLLLSTPLIEAGYLWIAVALFAVGVGLGLITGPIATAAMANAPAIRSGLSSGLVNVARMIGATLGVAVLGLLFGGRLEDMARDAPSFMTGMHAAFLMGAISQFAGVAIAVIWFRRDSLETPAHQTRSVGPATTRPAAIRPS